MRSILPSVYLSTGFLHACSAIPIPHRYSGQHDVMIIGLLTCLGIGSFMLGVCIFCKKKSGKFKKFKDGDIIQEVISTEYPILKALNALDSSVPCAVIPSSPNNLSTDNLLDKIETYQIEVDHRHDSYCTRRSDPLTSTYDEFDPNDEPDDERMEATAAVMATIEPPLGDEPLRFSDVFDELTGHEKCALSVGPVAPLQASSGEEDDECPAAVRSDAEDEDERRPLVSDESIDEAAATTTATTTITVTATTMAQSADAISIEEALRALDIAIEGEEDEDDEDAEENEEGQSTPLRDVSGADCSSPSLYSEPSPVGSPDHGTLRQDVERRATELVDDVLYQCQYLLQMMDTHGSNLSPLEADEFSPHGSQGNVFDGWGTGLELGECVSFRNADEDDDDDDWWKETMEAEGECSWNRTGNDPFQDDGTFDLLRQQLTQLLPQANDFSGGASKLNADDLTTVSPKAADTGSEGSNGSSSVEENEIIINYNRSLSPILEENEDECSLPGSTSVAHCSNLVESTIVSTEGPVVCEATESVPALARRSSLTASNDTLFNLEDVLEDRCLTPLDDSGFPSIGTGSHHSLSPRSVLLETASLANSGLDKLYTFSSRLLPTAPVTSSVSSLPTASSDDHHLFGHLHHHVLLSSLCLQDLDTGDMMESPSPPPPPPPLPVSLVTGGSVGGSPSGAPGGGSGLLIAENKQETLPSSA
ncbi:uncharacterized protein LOC131216124 [Anopheles bellator]|uniref:uncharacterized protein LOC131216124 n=1 Tax=Anopheles bellator TaxID=139047 RepID=UPI0026496DDC|nr:uncharacterized protein LOC131216124 [Anopheles bellator]